MMTIVYIVKVRDTILEETRYELAFERTNTMYHGPLFVPHRTFIDCGNIILSYEDKRILYTEDILSNDLKTFDTAISLCKKYGIDVYETTMKTMRHWSYLSGFTKIIHHT